MDACPPDEGNEGVATVAAARVVRLGLLPPRSEGRRDPVYLSRASLSSSSLVARESGGRVTIKEGRGRVVGGGGGGGVATTTGESVG